MLICVVSLELTWTTTECPTYSTSSSVESRFGKYTVFCLLMCNCSHCVCKTLSNATYCNTMHSTQCIGVQAQLEHIIACQGPDFSIYIYISRSLRALHTTVMLYVILNTRNSNFAPLRSLAIMLCIALVIIFLLPLVL